MWYIHPLCLVSDLRLCCYPFSEQREPTSSLVVKKKTKVATQAMLKAVVIPKAAIVVIVVIVVTVAIFSPIRCPYQLDSKKVTIVNMQL